MNWTGFWFGVSLGLVSRYFISWLCSYIDRKADERLAPFYDDDYHG